MPWKASPMTPSTIRMMPAIRMGAPEGECCNLASAASPRHRDRAKQRPGLALRLLPFAFRHRVGDDAGAGLHARYAVRDHARTDRDRRIHAPATTGDVTDRACIG